MKAIPRRDDDLRFVPPTRDDDSPAGIREGDDGDFLIALWKKAQELAAESVGTLDANLIADGIMDAVAEIRRTVKPTFLDDPAERRVYVLRSVANGMNSVHTASQLHVKLHAMNAHLIAANTTSACFPAPDARRVAALREDEKSDLMGYVWKAVEGLPEKCREIVYLTYIEDLWPREIAEKKKIKVDSVHSHLKRAHQVVREAVRQYLIDHLPETHT